MLRDRGIAPLALLTFFLPGLAVAASIELISKAPPRIAPDAVGGTLADERPALNADGRYVAFVSFAPNLVPGQNDFNLSSDVFLHDRVAGTNWLVSHAAGSPETAGDRGSQQASLSADGRFVAFASAARNLVPGAGDVDPEGLNVYLWDRESGQTTLVSRSAGGGEGGDGSSRNPELSADGNVLVFTSRATDLVSGLDLSGSADNVYLYERASGTLSLVSRSAASASHSGNNSSFGATVSADGRFVAYLSGATDLVAGQTDANGAPDVFLFDRLTGATTRVSQADGASQGPSLSADGRYVAFESLDANGRPDAFLYDRLSGAVSPVSSGGGFQPEISENGSTVVYFLGPPSQGNQIIAYDVLTGSRSLVTRALESPFTHANRGATSLSLSADGRTVAFTSNANNLVAGFVDANERDVDVFVHDRATGATVLASHDAGSPTRTGDRTNFVPTLSADGSWLAYVSLASNLVAGARDGSGTTDLFLYELATGANRVLTRHPPGLASLTAIGSSQEPSVSADGRYVAFVGIGGGLLPGLTVPDFRGNIYLYDRVTRQTILVSRSTRAPLAGGNASSGSPLVSRDGSAIAFVSMASDLVPGQEDRAGTVDVFLWDRRTGRTTLVSRDHASRTRAGTGHSRLGGVSADGNVVAFNSNSPSLVARQVDPNGINDVFLWDRRTGVTTLVSHNGRRPSRAGNEASFFSSMSPDGAFIAFASNASDLLGTGRDLNAQADAFLYERRTGQISLLSRAGNAFAGTLPMISANGRWVAFVAFADQDATDESLVVLDRTTGNALRIFTSTRDLSLLGFSDDGRWLLFSSNAPDLIPGQADAEDTADLFLFDRVSRHIRLVSHVPGDPLRTTGRHVFNGSLSPNGRWVAFQSDSPLLLPVEDPDLITQVFLYDRTTEDVTLVSRSASDPTQAGNSQSSGQVVVNSGLVAFTSQASNLVHRDFNISGNDVFVYIPENP